MLEIRDYKFLDDGRILVNTIGGKRFEVLERDTRDGYSTARVKLFTDSSFKITEELKELHRHTYKECEGFLNSLPLMIKVCRKNRQQRFSLFKTMFFAIYGVRTA